MSFRNQTRLAVLISLSGLIGCAEKSSEPTMLEAKSQPYVLDVPVPRNFELDERRSTHDFTPGKRHVQHFYMGKDKTLAAKNFYRQKMQERGWELLDDQLRNGVFILRFKNADENCEVRIEDAPSGGSRRTQVCVEIKKKY